MEMGLFGEPMPAPAGVGMWFKCFMHNELCCECKDCTRWVRLVIFMVQALAEISVVSGGKTRPGAPGFGREGRKEDGGNRQMLRRRHPIA